MRKEEEALRCQTTYQGPPERLGFQKLPFLGMAGAMGLRVPAVGDPDEFVPTCGIGQQIYTLRGDCPLSPVTFCSKEQDSWLRLHQDTPLKGKEERFTSGRRAWRCDWDFSVGPANIQATLRAWRTRSDSLNFAPFWCGLLLRVRKGGV